MHPTGPRDSGSDTVTLRFYCLATRHNGYCFYSFEEQTRRPRNAIAISLFPDNRNNFRWRLHAEEHHSPVEAATDQSFHHAHPLVVVPAVRYIIKI